jgi:glycine dehydrogenase subunit 1
VVELSVPAKDAVIHLLKDEILAGIDLSTYYPELNKHLLVCTTEMSSAVDIEVFTRKLARFL